MDLLVKLVQVAVLQAQLAHLAQKDRVVQLVKLVRQVLLGSRALVRPAPKAQQVLLVQQDRPALLVPT